MHDAPHSHQLKRKPLHWRSVITLAATGCALVLIGVGAWYVVVILNSEIENIQQTQASQALALQILTSQMLRVETAIHLR